MPGAPRIAQHELEGHDRRTRIEVRQAAQFELAGADLATRRNGGPQWTMSLNRYFVENQRVPHPGFVFAEQAAQNRIEERPARSICGALEREPRAALQHERRHTRVDRYSARGFSDAQLTCEFGVDRGLRRQLVLL